MMMMMQYRYHNNNTTTIRRMILLLHHPSYHHHYHTSVCSSRRRMTKIVQQQQQPPPKLVRTMKRRQLQQSFCDDCFMNHHHSINSRTTTTTTTAIPSIDQHKNHYSNTNNKRRQYQYHHQYHHRPITTTMTTTTTNIYPNNEMIIHKQIIPNHHHHHHHHNTIRMIQGGGFYSKYYYHPFQIIRFVSSSSSSLLVLQYHPRNFSVSIQSDIHHHHDDIIIQDDTTTTTTNSATTANTTTTTTTTIEPIDDDSNTSTTIPNTIITSNNRRRRNPSSSSSKQPIQSQNLKNKVTLLSSSSSSLSSNTITDSSMMVPKFTDMTTIPTTTTMIQDNELQPSSSAAAVGRRRTNKKQQSQGEEIQHNNNTTTTSNHDSSSMMMTMMKSPEMFYLQNYNIKITCAHYITKVINIKRHEKYNNNNNNNTMTTTYPNKHISSSSYINWNDNYNGYTCKFICPISNVQYPSGTVLQYISNGYFIPSSITNDTHHIYYTGQNLARKSAIMYAIDIIQYQMNNNNNNNNNTKKNHHQNQNDHQQQQEQQQYFIHIHPNNHIRVPYPKYCVEDPSLFFQSMYNHKTYTNNTTTNRNNHSSNSSNTNENHHHTSLPLPSKHTTLAPTKNELTKTTTTKENNATTTSTTTNNNRNKTTKQKTKLSKATSHSIVDKKSTLNINGTIPKHNNNNSNINDSIPQSNDIVLTTSIIINNNNNTRAHYNDKDVIVEDGYNTTTTITADNIPTDDVPIRTSSILLLDENDGDDSTHTTLLLDDKSDDDDDDDGVITILPNTYGISPALRVLEKSFPTSISRMKPRMDNDNNNTSTSTESISEPIEIINVTSERRQQNNHHHRITSTKPIHEILNSAEAWLYHMNMSTAGTSNHNDSRQPKKEGNIHRIYIPRNDTNKTLILAKMILAALSDASQITPLGQSAKVEALAKRIIDSLWKLGPGISPDTDTYTYFLQCIDGINPIIAMEKAETIVEAMINGTKHTVSDLPLPKPNQGTYNALIQITAQMGGISGRYPRYTSDNFIPDRQSFISILSSCIYAPKIELEVGGFDHEFVEECIQRMTELSVEYNDTSLIPDIDVYNAPLRWTGGPILWSQSRPHARYIVWDDYERIYRKIKTNLHDDDLLVQQARNMELWLRTIEQECINNPNVVPNIETYEAIIQGWLRTGTEYGLKHAQKILQNVILLSKRQTNIQLRLQTFHPIIASLYHSNQEDSPSKIIHWIHKWETYSKKDDNDIIPALDHRLVKMKLVATLKRQEQAVFHHERYEVKKNISKKQRNDIVKAATHCTNILTTACTFLQQNILKGKSIDQILDMTLFILASRAWENVALVGVEMNDEKLVLQAVSEMILLYEQYEYLVRSVRPPHGVRAKIDAVEMNPQIEHLIYHSHEYFHNVFKQLIKYDSINQRPKFLTLFEKMTRAVGEYEEIETQILSSDDSNYQPEYPKRLSSYPSRSIPEDAFDYQIRREGTFNVGRQTTLWQVVNYLRLISRPDQLQDEEMLSDMVRLCLLTIDVGTARRRVPQMTNDIDVILQKILRTQIKRCDAYDDNDDCRNGSDTNKKKKNGLLHDNMKTYYSLKLLDKMKTSSSSTTTTSNGPNHTSASVRKRPRIMKRSSTSSSSWKKKMNLNHHTKTKTTKKSS